MLFMDTAEISLSLQTKAALNITETESLKMVSPQDLSDQYLVITLQIKSILINSFVKRKKYLWLQSNKSAVWEFVAF